MRITRLLLVTLVASAFAAAGCGSDNKGSSSSTPASAATAPASTASTPTVASVPTGPSATTAPSASVPTITDPEVIKAAIEGCKSSIDAQPSLADNVKSDLKKVCEKAANGDKEGVAKATKAVCTKIVEANVPAGDARTQALSACDSAGP